MFGNIAITVDNGEEDDDESEILTEERTKPEVQNIFFSCVLNIFKLINLYRFI